MRILDHFISHRWRDFGHITITLLGKLCTMFVWNHSVVSADN